MSTINPNDFPIGSPQNPIIADYSLTNISSIAANQSTIEQSSLTAAATNLSARLPTLDSPTLTWLEYLTILGENNQRSKEELLQSQITSDVSTTDRRVALALDALNNLGMLTNLKAVLSNIVNNLTDSATFLQANESPTNAAIDAFNDGRGADQDATDALQSAINEWNNSDQGAEALAAYQAAIATYNAYVDSRNQSINGYNNGTVPNWNNVAQQYNDAANSLNEFSQNVDGLDQLDTVALLPTRNLLPNYNFGDPAPSDPTNASVPQVSAPNVDNLADPTIILNDYFTRIQAALLKLLQDAEKGLRGESALIDFIKYYIGNLATLTTSSAYLNPDKNDQKEIAGGQSTPPAANDSLSSVNLLQIISKSILDATATSQLVSSTQINPTAVNGLGNSIVSALGLSAVIPSLSVLADKAGVLQPGSDTLNIALDAQSLLTIVGALNTGLVLDILDQKLKILFPTLTDEERQQVLQGLIAGIVAVIAAKVGESTDLPGLVAQLAAGASGKPEDQAVADQNEQQTFSSTVTNRTIVDFIIEKLEDSISKLKLEQSKKALEIASQAFQESVQDANRSALEQARAQDDIARQDQQRLDSFNVALRDNLVNQGIAQQDAQRLAQNATQLIQSQIQQQSQQVFETNQDTIRQDVLRQSIAKSLQNQGLVTDRDQGLDLAQQVTTNVFGGAQNLTETQIRASLSRSLENAVPQISQEQAASIAASAAIVPVVSKEVNPLTQPNLNTVLSKPEFSLNLVNAITDKISSEVGLSKGLEIASRLTIALNGAADANAKETSARDLLTHVRQNDTRTSTLTTETFTNYVTQFSSITELQSRLTDPANALLLSQLNGITYSQPGPTPGMGQGGDVPPTSIILG